MGDKSKLPQTCEIGIVPKSSKTSLASRIVSLGCAACFVIASMTIGVRLMSRGFADNNAPSSPPIQVCGNTSELNGPASVPVGSITIAAGDNSSSLAASRLPANTTYYLAAGTHTIGTGEFGQIQPGQNDTFIGAPGAILNGQSDNRFAFVGTSSTITGVTIEYLTIENFMPPGSQGAVNTNSNDNWTIQHDTIENNLPGAAMMIGSNNTITHNCLTNNGEYAFNGFQDPSDPESSPLTSGPQNISMTNNEISFNNTCNWDAASDFPITSPAGCAGAGQSEGCGCDGGGKFWAADTVTFNDNYVHDNYSVGMWADTNNTGFDVEGNYFSNNLGEGIIYEISYNALIKNNTFIDNANGGGPQNPGFPDGAIYISESGGDSRVPGFSSGSLDITNNVFTDNWSGVVLWENSNRYCASSANSSSGDCTLVNPSVANLTTCANAADLATTPYINDCRWKTQNVSVSDNVFNLTPSNIGADCTQANTCGFNAMFSEFGTFTPYNAWVVPENIANNQNNVFSDNTYNGPWSFMGFDQGDTVDWSQWSSGFDDWNGSGDHFNAQDAGSTFNGTPPTTVLPSTPGNVTAVANSSTSVTVSWDASTDTSGTVAGYRVLRGGTQIATVNAPATTYNDTSVSASTQYSYTVEAYDTAMPANVSAASSTAVVTTPSGSQSPPSVNITSLTNNALIHGGALALSASATPVSGNTISQAQLLVNNAVVQTLISVPFNFTLNTLSYKDGSYTVSVKATDNHGSIGSGSVTAIITNGDINTDNKVNISDLAIMAGHWNQQSGAIYGQGDITGDGKVNIQDLAVMANSWEQQWL